jgi:hypothetical protein
MTQYRVNFFNNLINSNGMPFKCRQREVIVDNARDAEAASEKAKREFGQLEDIPNWRCHAQYFEVDIVAQRSTAGDVANARHRRSSKALQARHILF